MRCASKAAEGESARLCADAEAEETTATDILSVAEATSLCHLVMQALVMKTLVSSRSTSSVSRTLLIRIDGSVSTAIESKPPARRGMDDAIRRSIFG
uniref:Uncharacterized protein n=1 Tax=Peronospora matthiolae TaxID=2874970 RepID=A0AAV1UV18_9STRA